MYTVILSIIITTIICAIIIDVDKDLYGEIIIKGLLSLIPGILIGSFIGIIITSFGKPPTKIVEAHREIICLKDNSSIQGNFFIGCGNTDGIMTYSMYIKSGNNINLRRINYNEVSIQFIENNEKPELIEKAEIALNRNWFFFCDHVTEYVIKIPKNSIKQEIKLDAE